MSIISAIQRSDELTSIYGIQKQTRPQADTSVNPFSGKDTVQFSEEALALLGKSKANKQGEDEGGAQSLFGSDSEETAATGVARTSLKEAGKSMFAIMLESLFLADLEENAEASAQSSEDGMPAQKSSPLADSGKAAEIKKLMNDVASGKADISDLPKAMAVKSGGAQAQAGSPAAKKTGAASATDDAVA